MQDAFKKADDVLLQAVQSIAGTIERPGVINIDFNDVKTAMTAKGHAMMGIGRASGEDRARQAAEQAIRSPLLDQVRLENAKGVLINITSADDVKPREIDLIAEIVGEIADLDEGDIFFGTVFDPDARDELRVTVIATGLTRDPLDFSKPQVRQAAVAPAAVAEVAAAPAQDDEDAPAISRRAAPAAAAPAQVAAAIPTPAAPQPAPAARPAPMSIQDYLKNQQKK